MVNREQLKEAKAMSIRNIIDMLIHMPGNAQPVFSSLTYGDFDLVGDAGTDLVSDNSMRPILLLRVRYRKGGKL